MSAMKETRVKNFVLSQEADHSQVRGEDAEEREGEDLEIVKKLVEFDLYLQG